MELFVIKELKELAPEPGGGQAGSPAWSSGKEPGFIISDDSRSDDAVHLTEREGFGDYGDILGQHQAKRAMIIAAAGMHNVLLQGPPGTGKTMLLRRLPGLLPRLSEQEALEVTKIYSVAGKLGSGGPSLITTPPFRAPHHTISAGGLIGGGSIPKPGEATMAHRGILFLDELPEFSRTALESLRQPLEDKLITISRSRAVFTFPASFMLAV